MSIEQASASTFNAVANWNTICGKPAPEFDTLEYYEVLENQLARIKEEFNETLLNLKAARAIREAIEDHLNATHVVVEHEGEEHSFEISIDQLNKCNQEVLDGGCDMDVTVAGLNFLSGHNYGPAIQSVLANNDAKYTPNKAHAEKSLLLYPRGTTHVVTVNVDVEPEQGVDMSDVEGVLANLSSQGYDCDYDEERKQFFVNMYSVHRIEDDKICKLTGHPKVDLKQFTKQVEA